MKLPTDLEPDPASVFLYAGEVYEIPEDPRRPCP